MSTPGTVLRNSQDLEDMSIVHLISGLKGIAVVMPVAGVDFNKY